METITGREMLFPRVVASAQHVATRGREVAEQVEQVVDLLIGPPERDPKAPEPERLPENGSLVGRLESLLVEADAQMKRTERAIRRLHDEMSPQPPAPGRMPR